MKVKLFTHTDLDGVGCAILGKIAFNNNIDIEYCDYEDINEKVLSFLQGNCLDYSHVFITDISVNEEMAEILDTWFNNVDNELLLLDHHKTSKWLNKYQWARSNEFLEYDVKNSGTMMFYYYLIGVTGEIEYLPEDHLIYTFAEIVRRYDTWEWKTKFNDSEPKQWNDLLYIVGRDDFISKIIYKIKYEPYLNFSNSELDLLKYKQIEIDRYIKNKNKQIIKKNILGFNSGIVFAEQYHSECGNKLSELNPDLDFIVLINPSYSISYRTINNNIDLGSDIAKTFNGGGHPKAAGSPLPDNFQNKVIDLIFYK